LFSRELDRQSTRKASILCVDDERSPGNEMAGFFNDNDMKVWVADSDEEGQKIFDHHPIDLVVTDLYMPGVGGAKVVADLRAAQTDLPIIVLTGHIGSASSSFNQEVPGASCVFAKPVRPNDIWKKVCDLLDDEQGQSVAVH